MASCDAFGRMLSDGMKCKGRGRGLDEVRSESARSADLQFSRRPANEFVIRQCRSAASYIQWRFRTERERRICSPSADADTEAKQPHHDMQERTKEREGSGQIDDTVVEHAKLHIGQCGFAIDHGSELYSVSSHVVQQGGAGRTASASTSIGSEVGSALMRFERAGCDTSSPAQKKNSIRTLTSATCVRSI